MNDVISTITTVCERQLIIDMSDKRREVVDYEWCYKSDMHVQVEKNREAHE